MPNTALTEVLASYVPKLIQNRIIADPSPIKSPVSEQVHVAIFFADISGFTLLTERLAEKGPAGVEVIARILNEYFGQLIDIIHAYGGTWSNLRETPSSQSGTSLKLPSTQGRLIRFREPTNGNGRCAPPNAPSRSANG